MSNALYTAASGMNAQQLNIDSLYSLPPLRMRPPTDGSAGDTP